MTPRTILMTSFALIGCSGDPLAPGAGDDPGTGTGTLRVDADIEAEAVVGNSADASQYTTQFTVRLRRGDVPVTAGVVSVTSLGGTVPLAFDPGDGGRWRGAQNGYFEVYQLDAESDSDYVRGVVVDGPDLHVITSPTSGASLDATQTVMVRWSADEPADNASIKTKKLEMTTVADTGEYALVAGALKSKDDGVEQERIEVRRSDVVSPAGAMVGSTATVRLRNQIDVVVMPTRR